MALDVNNNYLQDLVKAGNDAHTNLYEIMFSGGNFTGDLPKNLSVRTSGFNPPDVNQESYTVKYITAYIDWPRAKVNITRNFTCDIRVDSYWNIYKALLKQQKITMNPSHDFVATNLSFFKDKLFNVSVYALSDGMKVEDVPSANREKLFEFRYCWISTMKPSDFSRDASEPIKVSATINFLEMYDRESGFPGGPSTIVDVSVTGEGNNAVVTYTTR